MFTAGHPCPGIISQAIRLLCAASTKSYGGCVKKEILLQELFGHTRLSEVLKNKEDLLRFKQKEMSTMQWKIVSPCVFSVKCKTVVHSSRPCLECFALTSNAVFRSALQRHKRKKACIQDGSTTTGNLEFLPKTHLGFTSSMQIVLKHVEAFQPLVSQLPGFLMMVSDAHFEEGTESSLRFWFEYSKAAAKGAFASNDVFKDLCDVMMQGITNMRYSQGLDDFVASLSCFSPKAAEVFVRTLGKLEHVIYFYASSCVICRRARNSKLPATALEHNAVGSVSRPHRIRCSRRSGYTGPLALATDCSLSKVFATSAVDTRVVGSTTDWIGL